MCGVPAEAETDGVDTCHIHCVSCFRATTACSSHTSCPVIMCEHGCGQQLHSCKLADHQLVCMAVVVECINAAYGCPVRLKRRLRGRHLQHCCASVLVCSATWCRRCSTEGGTCRRQLPLSCATAQAAALEQQLVCWDQHRLLAAQHSPASHRPNHVQSLVNRQSHESHENDQDCDYDRYSETECVHGLGGNLCRLCHCDGKHTTENPTDSDQQRLVKHWQCSPCPLQSGALVWTCTESVRPSDGGRESPMPVAVERRAVLAAIRQYQQWQRSESTACPPALSRLHVQLSDTPESVAAESTAALQRRPNQLSSPEHVYRVHCQQLMRRDELADHYRLQHVLLSSEPISLFCPLRVYGCDYFVDRLVPDFGWTSDQAAGDCSLRHHVSLVDDHVACRRPAGTSGHGDVMTPGSVVLSLPDELLLRVLSLLDSCSLRQVASTCRRFRTLCAGIVDYRGMAIIEWQRQTSPDGAGRSHWFQQPHVRWRFSRHCETTPTQFRVVAAHLVDHLTTCPFRQVNLPNERYSILPPDAHLTDKSNTNG